MRHEHALDRLKTEIRAVLGEDTQVTKSKVQQMSYLRCVLKESKRSPMTVYSVEGADNNFPSSSAISSGTS